MSVPHRWSGWPGAWCLDCGAEDRTKIALADGEFDISEDGETLIVHAGYENADCPEPGSNNHNPYIKRNM